MPMEQIAKYMPGKRHILPIQIRRKYYDNVRKQIFDIGSCRKRISERILKIREKYKRKKQIRKVLLESITKLENNKSSDSRVYIEVELDGKKVSGLLDSGASVSILGKNVEK